MLWKEEVLTVPGSRSIAIGNAYVRLRSKGWMFSRAENKKQDRKENELESTFHVSIPQEKSPNHVFSTGFLSQPTKKDFFVSGDRRCVCSPLR